MPFAIGIEAVFLLLDEKIPRMEDAAEATELPSDDDTDVDVVAGCGVGRDGCSSSLVCKLIAGVGTGALGSSSPGNPGVAESLIEDSAAAFNLGDV